MVASGQHLAAFIKDKNTHQFVLEQRRTPAPGPNDILIEVHAVALNPIDYYQRDLAFPNINYPAIIGSDIAGVVVAVGSAVPQSYPQLGTRVTAFAPSFYEQGSPDYGAFQKYALVWSEKVTSIPDSVSFEEAAMIPMAFYTAWNGLYTAGVPMDVIYKPEEKKGLLIWGGSASVGGTMVQIARALGFTTYVTASPKHHPYLKALGATHLFDYHDPEAARKIIQTAKDNGATIKLGYDAAAAGALRNCLDVLKEFKGSDGAFLASAPLVPKDAPIEDGVTVKFVLAPADEEERKRFFVYLSQVWLKEKLANGEFVASPKMQLMEGGLEGLDDALDVLKKGVSCTKLVLKI